jgi:hypothetical protein
MQEEIAFEWEKITLSSKSNSGSSSSKRRRRRRGKINSISFDFNANPNIQRHSTYIRSIKIACSVSTLARHSIHKKALKSAGCCFICLSCSLAPQKAAAEEEKLSTT